MCGLKEGGAGQEPGRAEKGEEEARWSLHPEPNREQVSGSPWWTSEYTDTSAKEEAGCDGLFYASTGLGYDAQLLGQNQFRCCYKGTFQI